MIFYLAADCNVLFATNRDLPAFQYNKNAVQNAAKAGVFMSHYSMP